MTRYGNPSIATARQGPEAGLAGIGAVVIAPSLALLICGIVFWQLKESRGKPVPAAAHRAGR
jgi:hypothetical protein